MNVTFLTRDERTVLALGGMPSRELALSDARSLALAAPLLTILGVDTKRGAFGMR